MSIEHQKMAGGKWNEMKLIEQLANVGSEVERAIKWKEKNNLEYSRMAFERALELLDLTLADAKNTKRLKEIARVRELIVDYFFADNNFSSTADQWRKYFYAFNYAARLKP